MLPIEELITYENSAKLHPQERIDQITEPIGKFSFNDSIAIDENSVIVEDHGRLLAIKQLGETHAR